MVGGDPVRSTNKMLSKAIPLDLACLPNPGIPSWLLYGSQADTLVGRWMMMLHETIVD